MLYGPVGLSKSDRCDACSAQAKYQAYFWEGFLLFCAHHYAKHRGALDEQALGVSDEHGELV
jgi:hypothetical protein